MKYTTHFLHLNNTSNDLSYAAVLILLNVPTSLRPLGRSIASCYNHTCSIENRKANVIYM